jgi:hypothetical protein
MGLYLVQIDFEGLPMAVYFYVRKEVAALAKTEKIQANAL